MEDLQKPSGKRALHLFEESELGSLVSLLSKVFICRDVADSRIWKPSPSGVFSLQVFLQGVGRLAKCQGSFFISLAGLGSAEGGGFCMARNLKEGLYGR